MHIFCAQLVTETNTFCATPTGTAAFAVQGLYHGNASLVAPDGAGAIMQALRGWITDDGHRMTESLCAYAEPAGVTLRATYESLRDEILADLDAAMPVDAVLLVLHGAMVAEGYDDCEGDLLARIRARVGPDVPVGAELDLHCHLSASMLEHANVLVAFKEYPHTDFLARCRELYQLLLATAEGRIHPVTAHVDCRMVGLWHTTSEPMRAFVQRMRACEALPGVLSVSLGHGFPWGDVPDAGAKLWVVTNQDLPLAQQLASQLGQAFWAMRDAVAPPVLTLDDALDAALACKEGPVVIADVADNPGGGAPGDSTFVLRRLLERGIGNAALGVLYDPGAVQICHDAGVGATLMLRVGGKHGPASGDPIDLCVTVRALAPGHSQSMFGTRAALGDGVWLEIMDERVRDLHLVLVSARSQVFAPDAFQGLGLDALARHIVVVKSTQHFHAAFAPLAASVLYAATPGAIRPDFAAIAYRRRRLDYWPRQPDPHCGAWSTCGATNPLTEALV